MYSYLKMILAPILDVYMSADRNFGLHSELSMTYCGNQLVKTVDNADAPSLNSSLDFNNGRILQLTYDAAGRKLKSELISVATAASDALLKSVLPGEDVSVQAAGDDMAVFAGAETEGANALTVLDSRSYVGNYEFDGEMLYRINTPYGFFYNGRFIPTVKDYQGNIVGCCGPDTKYEYYPYGLPTSDNGIDEINCHCNTFVAAAIR